MTMDVPKNRGCFQCSQRRIRCDGAEPACRKCQKKGIACSGSGRIRFTDGVASKGRLKGCIIPVLHRLPKTCFDERTVTVEFIQPQKIRWKNERTSRTTRKTATHPASGGKCVGMAEKSIESQFITTTERLRDNEREATQFARQGIMEILGLHDTSDKLTESEVNRINDESSVDDSEASILPWIAPLNPQARMLFSHFAHQVAPAMVVFDHIGNGYRDYLLPMACHDEVLQRAISVVAAQHLDSKIPSLQHAAEIGRAAIISRLRQDSARSSPDRVFSTSTWATLIILLVGETVTGNSDYGHLLELLTCLVQNIGPVKNTPANSFLVQQTHMFEFLGKPLIGEDNGIKALQLPIHLSLDWTFYELPIGSRHGHILHLLRLAFIKASQIYVGRVISDTDQWSLIESLKQLVSQIGIDEPGSHALVWVYFIAAADSVDPEHRSFFIDRMNMVFSQTGFRNISAAVSSLSGIWMKQRLERWTGTLAKMSPVLTM